jgi:peptidoglycan/LPS O-acetylase OafA/YrhL
MARGVEVLSPVEAQNRETASVSAPETNLPPHSSRRVPELDGLRGLAIALVLVDHFFTNQVATRPPQLLGYLQTATRCSFTGVDLFFVLSGFLITGILLDERSSPNYFPTFYVRRVCRILPLYLVYLILVAVAYRFVYQSVGEPLKFYFSGRLPWQVYFSFLQNFWMAKRNAPGAGILTVTWSLAVEEQFYIFLPVLVRFVRRSALPYVFMAGVVIAPTFRLFLAFRFRSHYWATAFLLPARMDALFLGALCAYYLREPAIWNWLVQRRSNTWMVCYALLAGVLFLSTEAIPFTYLWLSVGYGWMAALYATGLILVLTDSQSILGRAMRWRWLVGLGAIAYSVYLLHVGVYGLTWWFFAKHGWYFLTWDNFGVTLTALGIVIVYGKLSWRYFEKPIVRWGHSWRY